MSHFRIRFRCEKPKLKSSVVFPKLLNSKVKQKSTDKSPCLIFQQILHEFEKKHDVFDNNDNKLKYDYFAVEHISRILRSFSVD